MVGFVGSGGVVSVKNGRVRLGWEVFIDVDAMTGTYRDK